MQTQIARALYFSLQLLRREPVRAAMADVKKTEFMNLAGLQDLQASRMIAQIKFAFENVPYYQKHYRAFASRIYNISRWDDVNQLMGELPLITKDEVQIAPEQFTALNVKDLRTYPDKTSGSTGTPLIIPCDQRAWAYRHALNFRAMRMHDVQIGEPYALFFGLHWNKRSRYQVAMRDWLFNRVRVSAFDISRSTFESYIKKVRVHHPTFFMGYPSALYDFCLLAREFGVDLRELKLKAVFTTAEPLWTYQRDVIKELTGARCVNQYGSAEGGFNAFECPEGNMHIAVESTWLRLMDEDANASEALITDMMLRAFPLINYAIGDDVRLKKGLCNCGRSHPMIESIDGRSGEPIVLPNGRRINANLPSYIFKPLAALKVIRRYRFLQRGNKLELFLVVSDKFKEENLLLVQQETRAAFGNDIQFTSHIVPELENLPNAKHKCFIVLPDEQLVK